MNGTSNNENDSAKVAVGRASQSERQDEEASVVELQWNE